MSEDDGGFRRGPRRTSSIQQDGGAQRKVRGQVSLYVFDEDRPIGARAILGEQTVHLRWRLALELALYTSKQGELAAIVRRQGTAHPGGTFDAIVRRNNGTRHVDAVIEGSGSGVADAVAGRAAWRTSRATTESVPSFEGMVPETSSEKPVRA